MAVQKYKPAWRSRSMEDAPGQVAYRTQQAIERSKKVIEQSKHLTLTAKQLAAEAREHLKTSRKPPAKAT